MILLLLHYIAFAMSVILLLSSDTLVSNISEHVSWPLPAAVAPCHRDEEELFSYTGALCASNQRYYVMCYVNDKNNGKKI